MGQRSQIYVSYYEKDKRTLVARYFQDNCGYAMVSRAISLTEWLKKNFRNLDYLGKDIARIMDIDFRTRSITDSLDIIKDSATEYKIYSCETPADYIFRGQDNNDGKLFISVGQDGTIKYAFTDCEIGSLFSENEYIVWDMRSAPKAWFSELAGNAELMTYEDINEFMGAEYSNVKTPESIRRDNIYDIAGEYYNIRFDEDEDKKYNLACDRYRKEILGDDRVCLSEKEEEAFYAEYGKQIMAEISAFEEEIRGLSEN